jgi:hypothetical protein
MPDLNEEIKIATVKKWDRAYRVIIDNVFRKLPLLTIKVQQAKLVDDTEFTASDKGDYQVKFNLAEHYPLLDPRDDSVIPDAALPTLPRHLQIQVLIYSQFKHTVK